MMPADPIERGAAPATREMADEVRVLPPVYRWYHKLAAVLLITLCLEIGLFLLIFPWTEYWDNNYFSAIFPSLRFLWPNTYFRGAISGLGVVNLYITLMEVFRLRRFARRP